MMEAFLAFFGIESILMFILIYSGIASLVITFAILMDFMLGIADTEQGAISLAIASGILWPLTVSIVFFILLPLTITALIKEEIQSKRNLLSNEDTDKRLIQASH